ncbi:MAG: helix-turn-helix domain-containing protein [Pseudomonadota bacterium]
MHPEDIKAAIRKQGHTLASVAASLRARFHDAPVTRGAVTRVVQGELKSRRIAQEIARITGRTVRELWPGKYPELEELEALRRARCR